MKQGINLLVTCSSKQRYDRPTESLITLPKLIDDINLACFDNKFLSIKMFEDSKQNGKAIVDNFAKYGIGAYIHENKRQNPGSHENGEQYATYITGSILNDLCLVFQDERFLQCHYTFIIEDDSPIILKKGKLKDLVQRAIDEMETKKDLHSVHFLRKSIYGKPVSIENYFKFHNIMTREDGLVNNYYFNFQPRICKTMDLYFAAKTVQTFWAEYFSNAHPEEGFEKGIKVRYLLDNLTPKYLAFDPEIAYSVHLGEEDRHHNEVVKSEPDIQKYYARLNEPSQDSLLR